SESHVFIEDEQDTDCIANDDSFQYSEEDAAECSRLPWIELSSAEIPPLILPDSSNDIPVPREYLLDVVELYELLRSYWRTLRLSPFLFEDFCAALSSSDNSRLLSEIHIVLLRMCFKNDDEEQVHFSGNETNNAYNIITACLEPMTYAEVLRQYLSCDPNVPAEVMEAVKAPNYPFVDFPTRLVLITFLSYRFLYSNEYKKTVVATGGRLEHEETCRACSKGGDVIQCDTCEAVFHMGCVSLEVKPDEWVCELCEKNKVRGVQDCLPLDEYPSKQPLRMEPIGRDRHGRFYWFVARRIFVHNIDESDLRYYSTAPQFYQLVKLMDPSFYEFHLCKVFFERLSDILEQMSVTLELSSDRRDTLYRENYNANKPLPSEVYLQQDNMHLMAEILSAEPVGDMKSEDSEEEPSREDEEAMTTLIGYFKTMLGLSHGRLVNNFWSGNVEESELLQLKKDGSEGLLRPDPSNLFRMGCPSNDNSFSKYTNFFVEHKFGEHPSTKKKMVDKKKYLCSKFSLMEEGEWSFEWSIAKGHTLYGSERLQTLYVAWTIGKILRKIPIELMQRKWRDALPSFKKELDSPTTSWQKLRDLLLRLECGMRRTLFLPQWWNNLGHTRLTRTTVEDRERLVKEAQRRKKEEREGVDALDDEIVVVKHTRMPHGISRELTRMRDEKYRVFGRGVLGGWIWFSRTLVRDIRKQGTNDETVTINKKVTRLEEIVTRLKQWRTEQEMMCKRKNNCVCYSPSCRIGIPSRSVCSDDVNAGYQSCYSLECRRQETGVGGLRSPFQSSEPISSIGVVKAYDPSRTTVPRKGVLGEDLPWPLPDVNYFVSRGSKRTSIFVVPQVTLRRLAKTGGRKAIYVPSFSATAKGNLQYWNYPTPRPCFDLCWRWLTVNCSSLQAVALQLRILWASVRWQDMKPEDDDPDRRVVNHYPDRDERRWISLHKEYAPPCIYERYRISIEVLPLDDDNGVDEEDDLSWTSSERERRKSARRRKPQLQSSRIRRVTQIKEEWVDGVDLKLYEIYDYWRGFSERFTNRIKPAQSTPQKVQISRPVLRPPQTTKERTASPVPNVVAARKAVSNQVSARPTPPPPLRAPSTPAPQQLRRAPIITAERSRTSQRINDFKHVSTPNEREDETSCDSTYTEGSELTGWEPRVAKRPRLSTPRMDTSRLLQTLTPPTSRTVTGRSYQVGYIRGGGRGTMFGSTLPARRITSYREFCRRRGVNMRSSTRAYRFDFENNEDEERAIAEAIAREEELMRQEEADKGGRPEPGARDPAGRPYDEDPGEHARLVTPSRLGMGFYSQPALPRYPSNLMVHRDDSPDTRAVKQVLETMVIQVCRWDKQFGWYKNLLSRPTRPHFDRFRRRMFVSQRETVLAEHLDRLRKEINKRRTQMENKAEELCGLPTPWRKSRMKSHMRASRVSNNSKNTGADRPPPVAINPAEISLGGDAVDWTKDQKSSAVPKEEGCDSKNEGDSEAKEVKDEPELVEESSAVADWQPSKRGPALPNTPKYKKKIYERSHEESSSSGSELRRRGRPRKRHYKDTEKPVKDKPSPLGSNPNTFHCICRTRYNPNRFYIACEMCFKWFHGDCVDVTEESAKEMDGWTCPECIQETQKACEEQVLYCTCRTPYNDNEFYVGCESCEGWYHPKCVGITKEEAEAMDEYVCPSCTEAQTTQGYESASSSASSTHATLCRADYPLVWRLLECVADHRMSWPFRQPVSLDEFPNYLDVVEHPIDLSIIQQRLENLEYQRLKDFTRDMSRLFENARIFYPRDSNVYHCAETLEKIFEHALVEVRAEIDARISGRKVSESRTIDSSLDIDTDQLIDVNLDVDPTMFLL
ncbi:hypothetical protein V3C99_012196, partial [Haemonchus contortus]